MTDPVREGDLLGGKYRIERRLGSGGMGVVLEATHLELGTRVAIKMLRGEAVTSDEARARFKREAQAAARIESDHVVRVSDVASLDDGTPYMVMELLRGDDLGERIREEQITVSTAVDWVLEACEALAEAHANGIVHRDLKPSNLFLARRSDGRESLKVLDFGISKAMPTSTDASPLAITDTHSSLGSPLYMSPEQVRSSKSVDHRTDIWSLGVVLYELLARKAPFDGESLPALCVAIVNDPPRPLRERRPDVPEGLAEVVEKCLEKKPEARFESIRDLANALAPYASDAGRVSLDQIVRIEIKSSLPTSELASTVAAPVPSEPKAVTQRSWGSTSSSKGRRMTPIIGVVLVGAAVLGGVSWMSRQPAAPSVATPTIAPPSVSVAPAPPSASASAVSSAVASAASSTPPRASASPPVSARVKPAPRPPVDDGTRDRN